jgi:hypothetical protein
MREHKSENRKHDEVYLTLSTRECRGGPWEVTESICGIILTCHPAFGWWKGRIEPWEPTHLCSIVHVILWFRQFLRQSQAIKASLCLPSHPHPFISSIIPLLLSRCGHYGHYQALTYLHEPHPPLLGSRVLNIPVSSLVLSAGLTASCTVQC